MRYLCKLNKNIKLYIIIIIFYTYNFFDKINLFDFLWKAWQDNYFVAIVWLLELIEQIDM